MVSAYLFGFVSEAMNEVADQSCTLSEELERSTGPQSDLQRVGPDCVDVENVTETALAQSQKQIKEIF